jgi:hypothetical protein
MSVRVSGGAAAASLAIVCAASLVVDRVLAQEVPSPTPATAKLHVKVSAQSGEPLRGATVNVTTSKEDGTRSTNAAGLARFSELAPGLATVQVLMNGWNPAGARVTLSAGNRSDLSVTLEPIEAPNEAEAAAPPVTPPGAQPGAPR